MRKHSKGAPSMPYCTIYLMVKLLGDTGGKGDSTRRKDFVAQPSWSIMRSCVPRAPPRKADKVYDAWIR